MDSYFISTKDKGGNGLQFILAKNKGGYGL